MITHQPSVVLQYGMIDDELAPANLVWGTRDRDQLLPSVPGSGSGENNCRFIEAACAPLPPRIPTMITFNRRPVRPFEFTDAKDSQGRHKHEYMQRV